MILSFVQGTKSPVAESPGDNVFSPKESTTPAKQQIIEEALVPIAVIPEEAPVTSQVNGMGLEQRTAGDSRHQRSSKPTAKVEPVKKVVQQDSHIADEREKRRARRREELTDKRPSSPTKQHTTQRPKSLTKTVDDSVKRPASPVKDARRPSSPTKDARRPSSPTKDTRRHSSTTANNNKDTRRPSSPTKEARRPNSPSKIAAERTRSMRSQKRDESKVVTKTQYQRPEIPQVLKQPQGRSNSIDSNSSAVSEGRRSPTKHVTRRDSKDSIDSRSSPTGSPKHKAAYKEPSARLLELSKPRRSTTPETDQKEPPKSSDKKSFVTGQVSSSPKRQPKMRMSKEAERRLKASQKAEASPKTETTPVPNAKTEASPVQSPKREATPVRRSKTEAAPVQSRKTEITPVESPKTEATPVRSPKTETTPVPTPKIETPSVSTVTPTPKSRPEEKTSSEEESLKVVVSGKKQIPPIQAEVTPSTVQVEKVAPTKPKVLQIQKDTPQRTETKDEPDSRDVEKPRADSIEVASLSSSVQLPPDRTRSKSSPIVERPLKSPEPEEIKKEALSKKDSDLIAMMKARAAKIEKEIDEQEKEIMDKLGMEMDKHEKEIQDAIKKDIDEHEQKLKAVFDIDSGSAEETNEPEMDLQPSLAVPVSHRLRAFQIPAGSKPPKLKEKSHSLESPTTSPPVTSPVSKTSPTDKTPFVTSPTEKTPRVKSPTEKWPRITSPPRSPPATSPPPSKSPPRQTSPQRSPVKSVSSSSESPIRSPIRSKNGRPEPIQILPDK